jgi:ribonuclease-3
MAYEITEEYQEKLLNWSKLLNLEKIDHKLIITAFTHPSFKGLYPDVEDYERLEFLGDSVLDLISAEELIKRAHDSEGVLTEKRKLLVNNDYLATIFDNLKIDQLIRTAISYIPSTKDKANFVEALFGAIFLMIGYKETKIRWNLMQKKIGKMKKKKIELPHSPEEKENRSSTLEFYNKLGLTQNQKNAKSMLQELCQKQGLELMEYTLIKRSGPDHNPMFEVLISGVVFNQVPRWKHKAIGKGNTKKNAEIKAAEALCDEIFLGYIPSD